MAVKRIIYACMLIAAAVTFIVANSGIALFLLICLLVIPLISLVMLLIVRNSLRFDLAVREACIRGGTLQLSMRASVSPRFFVGGVKIVTLIENTTFHKSEYKSYMFDDLSFAPHVFDYNGANSGRINVRCASLRLVDLLGIFTVKVKCSAFAEAIVSPVLYENITVNIGDNGRDAVYGDTSLPHKGGDITEIYNVRDYVQGDAPNSIHWKLSGKYGTLKSKEFGATDDRKILILVDMSRIKFGYEASDEQLNAVLDVAISISNSLKSANCPHTVGWFDNGEFACAEVNDGNTFVHAVDRLMSVKVKDGNEEDLFYLARTAECAVFTKIIFVSANVNNDEFKQLYDTEVTAIEVGNGYGETSDAGVRIINIPCDGIENALASCVI